MSRTPRTAVVTGGAEDVADAVSFFAGARSGYVSGQVLNVAGGPVD